MKKHLMAHIFITSKHKLKSKIPAEKQETCQIWCLAHLCPAPSKPLHLASAGPVVTGGCLGGSVVAAALQRQTADMVGHADHGARADPVPALGRALRERHGHCELHTETTTDTRGGPFGYAKSVIFTRNSAVANCLTVPYFWKHYK